MIANVMKRVSGEHGVPCRYGGEEFIVLCPKTTTDNAHQIAERIRERFNQKCYMLEDEEKHFSVSLGVADYHYEEFTTVVDAVKKVDAALYASKHTGKNKVTDFTENLLT